MATADDGAANPRPVVLGHDLWLRLFAGRLDIVGQVVDLPAAEIGRRWVVAAVMPPGISFPGGTNLWLAVPAQTSRPLAIPVYARLAPGVTLEQARQRLPWISVLPVTEHLRPPVGPLLAFLVGISIFLNAAAFVHVVGAQLSDSVKRVAELGTRLALGASPGRLGREALVEGTTSGAALTGLALMLVPVLVVIVGNGMSLEIDAISIGLRHWDGILVLAVAAPLAVGVSRALGVWTLARRNAAALLRGAVVASTPARRVTVALLGAQIFLATMTLYLSGLAWLSLRAVLREELGFSPASLVAIRLPQQDYSNLLPRDQRMARYEVWRARLADSVTRLEALAMTSSLATSSNWPLQSGGLPMTVVRLDEQLLTPGIAAESILISAGYFSTIQASLREGREPSLEELRAVVYPPVGVGFAVVSEALASKLSPEGGSVVGRIIVDRSLRYRIAAVVGNLRQSAIDRPPVPAFYVYYPAVGRTGEVVLLRQAPVDIAAVQAVLDDVWGERAPTRIVRLERAVASAAGPYQARLAVISTSALVSIGFAVVAVIGATRLFIRQQQRNLAIHLALGAGTPDIVKRFCYPLVSATVGASAAGAVVAGLTAALGQSYLYETSPFDGRVIVAAAAVMIVTALTAIWKPASTEVAEKPFLLLRS